VSSVERVTLHQVNDDSDSYQAQVLHLRDGEQLGYRLDEDKDGRISFIPLESGIVAALAEDPASDQ
jgi:hypothetical protein